MRREDGELAADTSAARQQKIAIVHERLNVLAGAEKVVFSLHDIFPEAPIYTAIAGKELIDKNLPNTDVRTSFLQKWPLVAKYHQKFLPLYMLAFEQFDMSAFDVVISSSHCAAKSIITKPNACHICYCHSPMRYAWDMQHEYARSQSPLVRNIWSVVANYVRMWDYATAHRVDYFIANSNYIAKRIRKFYGKEAYVIHPPVNVDRFRVSSSVDDYYLVVSRFAPYKRIDTIIEAFNRLGWRLVVVGDGEQAEHLTRIAGPTIEFKGHASENEIIDYFAHCKGSIHAAEEDFGINMVESLAAGRPVVAYGVGGSVDIIDHGTNGILFKEQTVESLVQALKECDSIKWEPEAIRNSSLRFSESRFRQEFTSFVNWARNDFAGKGQGIGGFMHRDPKRLDRAPDLRLPVRSVVEEANLGGLD